MVEGRRENKIIKKTLPKPHTDGRALDKENAKQINAENDYVLGILGRGRSHHVVRLTFVCSLSLSS